MGDSSDNDYEEQIFYPTEGKYIVNAITGIQTNFRLGSKFERKFWKVLDVSLRAYNPSTGTGKTYFFPSPEVYENVKNVKISTERKNSWKRRQACPGFQDFGLRCACLSAHVCSQKTRAAGGQRPLGVLN